MSQNQFSKRLTPQGAESRERLLKGAIDLISERGYAATSVDAICRHAGTARRRCTGTSRAKKAC